MNSDRKTKWYTGRAKTVFIFGHGDDAQAVISSVVAQLCEDDFKDRIRFTGPVKLSQKTAGNIIDLILPLVDRILRTMGRSEQSFKVSVANLEAASMMDVGSNIYGHSAGVPIFLALWSARLQIPIADDIVSTGHIASIDGDIRMIKGMPAKLSAAATDDSIGTFIHPALDQDNSLQVLSPHEKKSTADALIKMKHRLKTIPVRDISDLVQAVFKDEQIVSASLKQGFYKVAVSPAAGETLINNTGRYFVENNEKRFWKVLEWQFLASQIKDAMELLQAFCSFYVRRKIYPKGFGRSLRNLVLSLPPEIRRLKIKQPLLSTNNIIQMSQFARTSDHEDVRELFMSAYWETSSQAAKSNLGFLQTEEETNGYSEDEKLKALLSEIDSDVLTMKIGIPIDTARAAYIMDSVTVTSSEDFNDTINSFFMHLRRHTGEISTPICLNAAGAEAFALLERAFTKEGGFKAALAEAKTANHGGLRFVLDAVTNQFKQEQQIKHVSHALKSALDPLDWQGKVNLIKTLIDRLKPHLPTEITSQPVERYAGHYESLVKAYVQSMDQVKTIFRSI